MSNLLPQRSLKIMPILCLSRLADKKNYVLQLISLGTVSPDSDHSLTPETLKHCVAKVNGSAPPYHLPKECTITNEL